MRSTAEMPYHIGLQVKLYPSDSQKRLIAVNCGVARAVYNHLVACNSERYRLKKAAALVPAYRKRLAYLDSVTGAVRNIKNALPYLCGKDVDEQAIANAVKNYNTAWKNQKERHTGVPSFKKKGYEQSYQTNAHYYKDKYGKDTSNVRFEGNHHVTLPKLGRIRIGVSPEMMERFQKRICDTRIGTVCIRKDAVGEYWASFSVASEAPFCEELQKTGSEHGIDLNLIELINDSEGNSCPNRRFYAKALKKLAKLQHRLSRMAERAKKEGRSPHKSKNYQKMRKRVAALHRRIKRQRADYLHTLSKQEVKNHDFIAAEDLKVSNLKKNHCLARAVSDAAWRTFLTMLQYKGIFYDKTVVLVPPQYTTQTCSVCGHVMEGEQKLTLADRTWECPKCHTAHERDTNAARNILKRGLQAVGRQPVSI